MESQYTFTRYYKEKYIKQIKLIETYYKNNNTILWKKELDNLLTDICLYYGLSKLMIDKIILIGDYSLYSEIIYNKFILKYNLNDEVLSNNNTKFLNITNDKKDKYFHIYGIESNKNMSLPGEEFLIKKSGYIINRGTPYFITESKTWLSIKDEDEISGNTGMIKDLNILLGCLLLSKNLRLPNINLKEGFVIKLPNTIYKNKITKKTLNYIKENIYIYEYVFNLHSTSQYNLNIEISKERFLKLYSLIDRDNHILLKILFYIYKSSLLYYNRIFFEESIGLLFFSLDGIIKLIMEKYDINKVKDVWGFLHENFGIIDLSDFIEELYDIRVEYTHAMNDISYDWCLNTNIHYYEIADIVGTLIEIYLYDKNLKNYDY
ncbi:MAG: hypothetical protein PHH06_01535 [Candidatus Gracilibacteria bacterium]|nr:hypothetical protein [Candidatus Gracilibacteria bacterium]